MKAFLSWLTLGTLLFASDARAGGRQPGDVTDARGKEAAAQLKKLRTGTVIGELRSVRAAKNKRDTVVEVLAPGEEKARGYTINPQQKEVLAALQSAKMGDRVEIEWYDTVEGLCVDKLRVLRKKPPE